MKSLEPSRPIVRSSQITVFVAIWRILGFFLVAGGVLLLIGIGFLLLAAPQSEAILRHETGKGVLPAAELIVRLAYPIACAVLSVLTGGLATVASRKLMGMQRKGIFYGNIASGLLLLLSLMTLPLTVSSLAMGLNVGLAVVSVFSLIYLNRKSIRRQFA
jgi:hypothetical protein